VTQSENLVGRVAERRVLGQVLDAAKGGRAGVVQIVGEPGIGKTRLLCYLHVLAQDLGFVVLRSRGTEFDHDVPYGVVSDLLEPLVSGRHRDLVVGMATADLDSVLPNGKVERYHRHRAMCRALELAARRRGLVVSLDDAHWADDDSLDCWAHLVRRLQGARVVLVLTHRMQPLPANLDAALADVHRAGTGKRLELGPLGFDDAVELMGHSRGPAWRQAVYSASGGNPLYLESLVRASGAGALPSTIRAALRAEVDVLDTDLRTAAWAAAVASEDFEPELLAEIAGISEAAALNALTVLCERDLVRLAGARRFRYRHPLVRQVVYESVAVGWRLMAHERALAGLARRGSPLLVQAYHLERAARFGDLAAVDTLVTAAGQAVWQSPATAAHWLRAALGLLPADASARQRQVRVALAEALTLAGQLEDSRTVLADLLRCLSGEPVAVRLRGVVLGAMVNRLLGHHAEARKLLVDELATVSDEHRREKVVLGLELAAVALMQGGFDSASRRLVDSVARQAAELGDRPLVAAACGMSVMAAFFTGDLAAIEVRADTAAGMVDALSDDELMHRLDAIIWLGWGELHHQRWDDALRHLDRGLRLARGAGQVHVLTYMLAARACALRWQGNLAEALDCAEDAVEAATLSGSTELGAMAHGMHSWIAFLAGDAEVAERAGAAATAGGNIGWWGSVARLLHSIARLALDRSIDVVDDVLAAGGGPELSGVDPFSRPLWYSFLTVADLACGRVSRAAHWAGQTAVFVEEFPLQRGTALITAARVAAVDDPAQAAALAREAVAAFTDRGLRLEAAEARFFAGVALARLGERDTAVTELAEAAEVFAACGARRMHAQTVAELRRLGRRVPSFDTARGRGEANLTSREGDVAHLLATGRTNQQIADELVISVKTVETHVTHILGKLGVSNRTAAIAALRDQH
jgi:DNA-binding CsgD family transcriptional regulator